MTPSSKKRPVRLTDEPSPLQEFSPLPPTAPKPKPAIKAGNGMSLRGNRDPHPAAPVMSAPRRSSATVQAEKKAKAEKKESRKAAHAKAIHEAAMLEDKMATSDKEAAKTANHPPKTPIQKKANKRPAKTGSASTAEAPSLEANEIAVSETATVKRKRSSRKSTNDLTISADSDTPAVSVDPNSGEDDTEFDAADLDDDFGHGLDDSGEDEPVKKKKKSKGEMRAEVQKQRVEKRPNDDQEVAAEPTKKKKKSQLEGLHAGWQNQGHRLQKANGTGTAETDVTVASADEDDDEYQPGGFGDEDGDGEEATKPSHAQPVKILAKVGTPKAPALTKVKPTTSVPELVTPAVQKRAKDIKITDLPQDVRKGFTKAYVPAVINLLGCLDAWSDLTSAEYKKKWKDSMPQDKHALIEDVALMRVIQHLVNERISTWYNSIAAAAVKELKALFTANNITTAEAIKAFVANLLAGTASKDDKYFKYNFYYQEVVYEDEELKSQKGLFQSSLISSAFAMYHKVLKGIAPERREPYNPEGALVLSVLAARRALSLYETGVYLIPSGQSGHFSQKQWGDRTEIVKNKHVVYKTTSNIQKLVAMLDNKTTLWDKVNEAALLHISTRTGHSVTDAIIVDLEGEEESEESEWELEDDDPDVHPIAGQVAIVSANDSGAKHESDSDVEPEALTCMVEAGDNLGSVGDEQVIDSELESSDSD